jgi:PAS domain S-box-containing protein
MIGTAMFSVEIGPGFRCLEADDAILGMSGFSRDEFVGRYLDELVGPDVAAERTRVFSEVARSGISLTYVLPVILPVGSRLRETTVVPVADPSGAITRLVLVTRDVIDRDEAGGAVSQLATSYETAMAYSSDGFMLIDAEGHVMYASRGCETLFGSSAAELVASGTPGQRVHPDDRAQVVETWVRGLAHPGLLQNCSMRVRHQDETWRNLDVRMLNKFDEAGVRAMLLTFYDASERRKLERTEVESSLRVEEILSGASDAIVTVDATQAVVGFNTAAETMFGYRADEVLGSPLAMLVPERFRDAHARHVKGFAAGGATRRKMSDRGDLTGRRKDGSEFLVEITISQVRSDGGGGGSSPRSSETSASSGRPRPPWSPTRPGCESWWRIRSS